MKYMSIMIVFAGILALTASGSLMNANFETTDGWLYSRNSDLIGSYSTSWSSEGSQSYQFYRNTGSTSIGYYAQITQDVDLTSVTGLLFDCQDTGIDPMKLQFLVDNVVIGQYQNNGHTDSSTSWGSTATVLDLAINFTNQYSGVHALAIRMQEIANYSPSDAKYYRIDNIRAIPEPASAMMLIFGAGIGLAIHRARRSALRR